MLRTISTPSRSSKCFEDLLCLRQLRLDKYPFLAVFLLSLIQKQATYEGAFGQDHGSRGVGWISTLERRFRIHRPVRPKPSLQECSSTQHPRMDLLCPKPSLKGCSSTQHPREPDLVTPRRRDPFLPCRRNNFPFQAYTGTCIRKEAAELSLVPCG